MEITQTNIRISNALRDAVQKGKLSNAECAHAERMITAGENGTLATLAEPACALVDAAMEAARFEYGHGVTRSSIIAIWKALGCPPTPIPMQLSDDALWDDVERGYVRAASRMTENSDY